MNAWLSGVDLFGHIAYAAVLAGMVLLTRQNIYGWLVKGLGDGSWVVLGILLGMSSIWLWGFFFVLLDLIGWRQWRRADREELLLVAQRLASSEGSDDAEEFFHSLGLDK